MSAPLVVVHEGAVALVAGASCRQAEKRVMGRSPRVALLVETSTTWGRRVIQGVFRYMRTHEPWQFFVEPRGRSEKLSLPAGWRADGVIARVTHPGLAQAIRQAGVPAINVSSYGFGARNIVRCRVSGERIGEMAANYLADRGLRNFAYYSAFHHPGCADRLGPAFARAAEARGGHCTFYKGPTYVRSKPRWNAHIKHLVRWLLDLPKPVGVLTFSDVRGWLVSQGCQEAGLRVPDDVAILGGEDDELSALAAVPEISSVDCGGERVGFAAAKLLDRLMAGEPFPQRPIEFAPIGIITRKSTEFLAIEDPILARAFRFIREHSHEPLTVRDVLQHVPLSRRAFERRFTQAVGRTPAATIRRLRLDRAKRLLCDTEMSIAEVAQACGYGLPEALTRAFRAEFGSSPSEFRRRPI